MRDVLISVIIPVYNTEKYLRRCVNSILNQSFSNIEIILVDDGSTDTSPKLCEVLSKKDERICVIHKENGGLSSARNAGLNVAKGNLITFIDSDDWLSVDTYEYCLNLMKYNYADVIEFNYIMVDSQRDVKQPKERINVYSDKDILQYYMKSTTRTGSYSVCRCIFPKSAVEYLRFREGKINEDIDFKYKALSLCNRLVTTNQYKYFYYQSGNSLSTGGLKQRDFDLYEAADELYRLTKEERYGSISKLGNVKKARTAFSLLSKIAYYGISDESINESDTIETLLKEHRRNVIPLMTAPLPVSRKIVALLFAINYGMTSEAIKFYKMMAKE